MADRGSIRQWFHLTISQTPILGESILYGATRLNLLKQVGCKSLSTRTFKNST